MSGYIRNGAPAVYYQGTQDLSTVAFTPQKIDRPTHCPKIYLFAEKGPTTPQAVVGDSRQQMFGSSTFDLQSVYMTHQTILANLVNAKGNLCMIQRVIPSDAGPKANVLLWADVLPTTVDPYQRDTNGNIVRDSNMLPVSSGTTITGYKVMFGTSYISTVDAYNSTQTGFGHAATTVGTQVDSSTGVQSTRYPLLQFSASSQGEYGNLAAIFLYSPTYLEVGEDRSLATKILTESKVFPYRMGVVRKADSTSTATPVSTIGGDTEVTVTFVPGSVDPTTTASVYIGDTFISAYENTTDPSYPAIYGDFGDMVIYQANIDTLTQQFYAAEKAHLDLTNDMDGVSAKDYQLFNFVGGCYSDGVPYKSYQIVTSGTNAVTLSANTPFYANGGSNGSLTLDVFNSLVASEMDRYADESDSVMNMAKNIESVFYDTGFNMATKRRIAQFIAVRPDTFVFLNPWEYGNARMSDSEERSAAQALRQYLLNYPESSYFATPCTRGLVMGRQGKYRNLTVTADLPVLMEVAEKVAGFMGAGTGQWVSGKEFDGYPGSILQNMYDINVTYTSVTVRNKDWDVGLNWVQDYDYYSTFIPALKTIYTDDTSVLTGLPTALAICEINKIVYETWAEFSGESKLSDAQLIERVDERISSKLQNKFCGRFKIVPNSYFTDADTASGYRWTTQVKIGAPNMKTVMTSYVTAMRLADMTTTK